MFKETEYDLFYLPWSDTGTSEVVLCIIDYSTRTWYVAQRLRAASEPMAPLAPGNHLDATRRFVMPRVVPHLAL